MIFVRSSLRRQRRHIAAALAMFFVAVMVRIAPAQGPAFPFDASSPYVGTRTTDSQPVPRGAVRVAQRPNEEKAGNTPAPSAANNPEAAARSEQQAAVLKLIASSRDAAKQRTDQLAKNKDEWDAKLQQLSSDGIGEPHPYSYLALDKARDELEVELRTAGGLRDAVTAAKTAVEQARADQDDKEREWHKAKDALEHNSDPAALANLTNTADDAEYSFTVAKETTELRRAELANLQLEQSVAAICVSYARQRVDLYKQDVVFTQSMLEGVLADLNAESKAATTRARQLSDDLTNLLQPQMYKASKALDDAKASQDEPRIAALSVELQSRELAQQAADYEKSVLVTAPERIDSLKEAWHRRYDLANSSIPAGDTTAWADDAQIAIKQLRTDEATFNDALDGIRNQLAAIQKRLDSAEASDRTIHYWLTESTKALEQKRHIIEKAVAEIEPARRVLDKLVEDLTSGTFRSVVSRWIARGRHSIEYIWSYELANVNENSITVARVVKGMLLFIIGIYASRMLSRAFGRRLLARMGFNASAMAAWQSVAFYALVVLFTLAALKLVQVPLTAFTVLGGALALGVGFGSQNIVNNFISGLILLAERPVKVGDLIQLADVYGNVEHIGARSTRVKTGENMDIIVPNSTFLQTNVVNWTRSDNHMRTHVKFGVMYGSSVGKVTHLALKAAANHDRVFDKPAPFVLFSDFGDNALQFELHFWVAVRTLTERRVIESDIRFNIDHLFREAGVVIAYPQRDMHVYTHEPIQVRMHAVPANDGGQGTGG